MNIFKKNKKLILICILALIPIIFILAPELGFSSDLRSGMEGIKNALSGVILPLLAVIGLVMAAFSFLTGNPNAKQHAIYAVVGAMIGFGAQAIIDFIRSSVGSF